MAREIPKPDIFTRPTDTIFERRLQAITHGLPEVVSALKTATHPRLKHPFQIVAYSGAERFDEITVNPSFYAGTSFRLANQPENNEEPTFDSAYFGYNINGDFRKIGRMGYIQVGEDGQITEIGFGSDLAQAHFRHHLLGRDLSEENRAKIKEVQKSIFDHLRADPAARKKLKEFAVSRGWPEGLEDIGYLSYFDNRLTPLEEFAERQGFTPEEMYLAGWYDLSFSNSGKTTYTVRDNDVIRIPYFNQDGEIELWRTRNLKQPKATTHKYTSWPLDRSINREFTVEEKLYNSWRLDEARGKTVVITEGEFKCLIATEVGKIFTVGVPGITEVDENMIKALVDAEAQNYVVILDRDPKAKGLMRVDGITDSERAAYGIAKQLQEAGAKNVSVGVIPDVRDGEKVGIDDLILDKGPLALKQVINQACSPEEYARLIKLNPTFFDTSKSRQKIKKAIGQYENSLNRGGTEVATETYLTAVQMRDAIETFYREYLENKFFGSRRIDQPLPEHSVLYKQSLKNPEKKIAITATGETISLDRFANDLIYFRFTPNDLPSRFKSPIEADLQIPFSMKKLQASFAGKRDAQIDSLREKGAEILGKKTDGTKSYRPATVHDLGTTILVGYLSKQFPADEYSFLPDVTFYVARAKHWDEHVQIPLTIIKKNTGQVIGFASVTTWEKGKDKDLSQLATNRTFNLTRQVLRKREELYTQDKFKEVAATIWPHWQERNYVETMEIASSLGITEEMAERYQLVALSPQDYPELINHFYHRRLLTQATGVGLLRVDEDGKFIPRFQGSVLIMPIFDEGHRIISLRGLPFNFTDHLPPVLDPDLKIVRHLDGAGRHLLDAFDPERQLYLQDRLSGTEGKNLVVAYHELDGLLLADKKAEVVALNSSFTLDSTIAEKIARSKPTEITIVISGLTPQSKYDDFNFDGIPGYIKDIYDLQEQINNSRPSDSPPISLSVTNLAAPLTHLATPTGLADEHVTAIFESVIPLANFVKEHKFNIQTHAIVNKFTAVSSRLMDYLEISALPDMLDAKPIDWYVRESRRLYAAVQGYARATHGIEMPSIEEYFQRRLNLDAPISLEELLRQRQEEGKVFLHRPLYSTHKQQHIRGEIANVGEFEQQFNAIVLKQNLQSAEGVINTLRRFQKPIVTKPLLDAATRKELVETNPRGKYNELSQRDATRFPTLEPDVTAIEGGFRCTLQLTIDEKEIIGTADATKKKDAEGLAYAQLMAEITRQGISLQPAKVIFETENPKGKVFEFLAQHHITTAPEIIPDESGSGFGYTISITIGDTTYTGQGHGSTKKVAEAQAFDQIYRRLPKSETAPSATTVRADSTLKDVVEKALRMQLGDQNYIGRLGYLQQMTKSGQPKWDPQQVKTDDGTRWVTVVSIKLRGVTYKSNPIEADGKQESKQGAALNLLSKLHEAFNEDN